MIKNMQSYISSAEVIYVSTVELNEEAELIYEEIYSTEEKNKIISNSLEISNSAEYIEYINNV